nr:MAG TPA: hypothetical protein [Caudoviricetes sp.]
MDRRSGSLYKRFFTPAYIKIWTGQKKTLKTAHRTPVFFGRKIPRRAS